MRDLQSFVFGSIPKCVHMIKYQLNLEGLKLPYIIKDLSDDLISEKIRELKLEEDVIEIRTGRGGQLALSKINTKYNVVYDDMFEPVCADSSVNPILRDGRRLSSHMLYIINGDTLIKLVPRLEQK